LSRLIVGWALLSDTVPLYPLYALLFAGSGLTEAEISALFALWSCVGIAAEVPSGAIADRLPRRVCLAVAGLLTAAGFALWTAAPELGGFAAGFVLWGIGGSLVSGAQEALLFDGLAAVGAQDAYVRVQGRVAAATLVAQLPAAGAASVLFALGGFALVGWVSVGVCLAASALALRLPEAPRRERVDDRDDEPSWGAALRAGVAEAVSRPAVRGVLIAAAVLGGLDAVEEYFPLVTADAGVPVEAVAAAMIPITLLGGAGAALGGRADRWRPGVLALAFAISVGLLGAAVLVHAPVAVAALALFYAPYRAMLVIVDARLQHRIAGPSRATVTSVAAFGTELAGLAVFGLWAAGGGMAVALAGLVVALALPRWLRGSRAVSS